MACRAVLFAITPEEAKHFLQVEGDDDAILKRVEAIDKAWDKAWLCELDKAWDAIHRCLAGGYLAYDNGEYPLSHALLGGRQLYLGEDWIVALVTPKQVIDVAKALETVSTEEMTGRYAQIPIEDYGAEYKSEEDLAYTLEWFPELRPFYERAAKAERAVIFTVDQ